ncbi:hypothetical protein HCH_03069 [Hahella chejuensis KCTC 2396]|uniref:Uncharacterized protein n=1 Tax=Hahella chejuensis (strain KCTC 2396) TaxID=349521 RepID=Q2SHN9_HAHCH|nr:hypothetical protein HCH_03069 [Hahella chejuensis KCTC 2396]
MDICAFRGFGMVFFLELTTQTTGHINSIVCERQVLTPDKQPSKKN